MCIYSKDEICLRCRTEFYDKAFGLTTASSIKEEGKCISRQGFDESNLIKYWSSCTNQNRGMSISEGTFTERKKTLSLEKSGFVNQSGGSFLFIKSFFIKLVLKFQMNAEIYVLQTTAVEFILMIFCLHFQNTQQAKFKLAKICLI